MGIASLLGFSPESLSGRNLCYFSAPTNLQELGIDYLQVSGFMPTVQQCFGHFSPTLRLLALKQPRGSCSRSCISLGSSQTSKISSSTTPSPTMSRSAQLTKPSFPSPSPHCEGETCEGYDRRFWWASFSSYGPLQGEVCTTPPKCVHRDPGDVEVVPV